MQRNQLLYLYTIVSILYDGTFESWCEILSYYTLVYYDILDDLGKSEVFNVIAHHRTQIERFNNESRE